MSLKAIINDNNKELEDIAYNTLLCAETRTAALDHQLRFVDEKDKGLEAAVLKQMAFLIRVRDSDEYRNCEAKKVVEGLKGPIDVPMIAKVVSDNWLMAHHFDGGVVHEGECIGDDLCDDLTSDIELHMIEECPTAVISPDHNIIIYRPHGPTFYEDHWKVAIGHEARVMYDKYDDTDAAKAAINTLVQNTEAKSRELKAVIKKNSAQIMNFDRRNKHGCCFSTKALQMMSVLGPVNKLTDIVYKQKALLLYAGQTK